MAHATEPTPPMPRRLVVPTPARYYGKRVIEPGLLAGTNRDRQTRLLPGYPQRLNFEERPRPKPRPHVPAAGLGRLGGAKREPWRPLCGTSSAKGYRAGVLTGQPGMNAPAAFVRSQSSCAAFVIRWMSCRTCGNGKTRPWTGTSVST